MRLFRFAVPTAVAVACAAGLTAVTASASPRTDTKPSAAYAMTTPCGSNSYCTAGITITRNPSSYNVRAWMDCTAGGTHYGNWKTSGTTSAGCGDSGSGQTAGFQYDKTHKYTVQCWIVSAARTGTC